MRPILVTGFEPFGKLTHNPSAEALQLFLKQSVIKNVVGAVLPVEYDRSVEQLKLLVDQHNPLAWIGLGLHQRTTTITLERVAHNLDDASLADNAGEVRQGVPIDPAGVFSLPSTLPLEAFHQALSEAQIPATYSDSAGRFVCNHIFYGGLTLAAYLPEPIPAGFIHVPWPSDWPGVFGESHSIDLDMIARSISVCVNQLSQLLSQA